MCPCLKKHQGFLLFCSHEMSDTQLLGCTLVGPVPAMLTPTNLCKALPYIAVSCHCTCWKALDSVCLSICPFPSQQGHFHPPSGSLGSVTDKVMAQVQSSLLVLPQHLPAAQPASVLQPGQGSPQGPGLYPPLGPGSVGSRVDGVFQLEPRAQGGHVAAPRATPGHQAVRGGGGRQGPAAVAGGWRH